MSEVVYVDLKLTRHTLIERTDHAGDVDCQAEVGVKPRRCNPVIVVLVVLCVLLMGAVIGLQVLWNNNCPKHRACAIGWEYRWPSCYFFSNDTMNWTQSRDNCVTMGGHLVIIDSLLEQTFLDDKVGAVMIEDENKFWIGLTDSDKEDSWLWVDNTALEVTTSYWITLEPDNWKTDNPEGENCARMGEKGGTQNKRTWLDFNCKKPQRRICEAVSSA
ncbi:hypothetical protein DPEC_G00200340 [Dallia pectoralis]|uniref:Uncharacterized protein n=1 Tax=Dallia pectoralis TaxID=75939 RepID=A0ACC2G8U1_DALPE|nr:hypothetical protein DPEC_G00200340 [Dallia pectoralis]